MIPKYCLNCVLSILQNPNLNFKEVTYELDHPGFIIRDSKGLQIVVYGIQRGLGIEGFPVDLIYRPWKHAEGQVTELLHWEDLISDVIVVGNFREIKVTVKLELICLKHTQCS